MKSISNTQSEMNETWEGVALHIVYFVQYDDTVSFMTLYPIQ